jgi:hypothetical protein
MSRKTRNRKSRGKNQKMYKMKGCNKTRKNLGKGKRINVDKDIVAPLPIPMPLVFSSRMRVGGGGSCNNSLTPSLQMPLNPNGLDKTMPNTGAFNGLATPFLNPLGSQNGGCNCGTSFGGGKKIKGGNQGIPYPNGLVGESWSPNSGPGVNGVQGDSNYLAPNNYKVDPQTAMIDTGAQPPFSGGKRSKKNKKNTKKQRGGFIGQDLINLGRQIQFGLGTAYNGINGYPGPVNPQPWKQLPNTINLNTVRAAF